MLPRRSQLALVRLPNILAFNPTPFDPETFEDELIDEEGQPKPSTANVIRWRDGGAGDARLSNARLVRWSDGSMTLHVGQEVLAAQQIPVPEGTTQLYLRHKGSNLEVCRVPSPAASPRALPLPLPSRGDDFAAFWPLPPHAPGGVRRLSCRSLCAPAAAVPRPAREKDRLPARLRGVKNTPGARAQHRAAARW